MNEHAAPSRLAAILLALLAPFAVLPRAGAVVASPPGNASVEAPVEEGAGDTGAPAAGRTPAEAPSPEGPVPAGVAYELIFLSVAGLLTAIVLVVFLVVMRSAARDHARQEAAERAEEAGEG